MIRVEHCDYFDFLKSLPDESVDLVVSDPPYGVDYQNNYTKQKHDKIANDAGEFSYGDLSKQLYRVLRNNCAIFLFTGWSTYSKHYEDVKAAGFKMHEPLICQKRPSGTTNLKGSFQTNSDWLIFATKGSFEFRETALVKNKRAGTIPNKGRRPVPQFKKRFPSCWFGEEYPFSTENPATLKALDICHPTVKSAEFISWLILMCSDEGGLVIDPFVGSGSVGVAAKMTNRNFAGCDIKPAYVELALRRLA